MSNSRTSFRDSDPLGAAAVPHSFRDPWLSLENLLHQLSTSISTGQSIMAAVDAARLAVGAEVGFWYSKSSGKASGFTGEREVSPERGAAIARELIARMDPERETMRWVNPIVNPVDGNPDSAIVACGIRTTGCIIVLGYDASLRFETGDAKAVSLALKMLHAQRAQSQAGTKQLLNGLLHCLTTIIDAKDPYTAGHSERVARIAVLLVKQMNLAANLQGDVYLAGLLHDVGKIGLSDEILQRPGKLTPEEMTEVRQHPIIGERIVASIKPFDRLRPAVRHHHEAFNGRGYPDRLMGENIPLLARVLAVADACDAMMSPRRYRSARAPHEIDNVFNTESGKQFDPTVVQAFMSVRHEIYPPIYQKGIGESAFHAIETILDNMTDASMLKLPSLKSK